MEWPSKNRSQLLTWNTIIHRVSWIRLTQSNLRSSTQRCRVSQLASSDRARSSASGSKSTFTFTGQAATFGLARSHLLRKSRISSLNMFSWRTWSLFIGRGALIASLTSRFFRTIIVAAASPMQPVHRPCQERFRRVWTATIKGATKWSILSSRMFGRSSK